MKAGPASLLTRVTGLWTAFLIQHVGFLHLSSPSRCSLSELQHTFTYPANPSPYSKQAYHYDRRQLLSPEDAYLTANKSHRNPISAIGGSQGPAWSGFTVWFAIYQKETSPVFWGRSSLFVHEIRQKKGTSCLPTAPAVFSTPLLARLGLGQSTESFKG